MASTSTQQDRVLFTASFRHGLGIFRGGERISIIPSCTHWDDDHYRVVERGGEALVQIERREYNGTHSRGTGEWSDHSSLGSVEGLTQSGYDDDYEWNVHVDSGKPLA